VTGALLDVNVLVALMYERHPHSSIAVQWLEARSTDEDQILTCRVTQMGALRLTTMRSVMGDDLLSATTFWKAWSKLVSDSRFAFVGEPSGFEEQWRNLTKTISQGSSAGTDWYLAALAIAGGWTFVTFDKTIPRVDGLKLQTLS
jgi:toxin-antitoxin system PIN domain toxin